MLVPLLCGAALLAAFWHSERRARDPLLPPGLLLGRRRVLALAAIALSACGTGMTFVVLSLQLQQARDWTQLQTSAAFVPFAVALIASGRAAGPLIGRYGARTVAVAGLGTGAAGLVLLALTGIDAHTSYGYGLLPGLVLLPAGTAASFAGAAVLATEGVPQQHNAGILRGTVPVGEVSEEDWDAVLRTNVTGVWLAMKHEIAHMKGNGGGAIVNISSNLGAHLRIPNVAAYITSKAAVSALTRAAALDHIHQGIRINAVSPGASAAPMSLRPGETEADRAERVKTENPLGRVAEAEEVAAAVLYLASPAAGAVVGTDLVIDSGASA